MMMNLSLADLTCCPRSAAAVARYDLLFAVAERGLAGDYDYGDGAEQVRAVAADACQVILGIGPESGGLIEDGLCFGWLEEEQAVMPAAVIAACLATNHAALSP
jgi:hypothetical protein